MLLPTPTTNARIQPVLMDEPENASCIIKPQIARTVTIKDILFFYLPGKYFTGDGALRD
jgi:hypothetical protein